jgi:broad specificity phosphatase PhoE
MPADMAAEQWAAPAHDIPQHPESMETAHTRYTAALESIAERHADCNVLVVTHGEAVRRSVVRLVGSLAPVFRRGSVSSSQAGMV